MEKMKQKLPSEIETLLPELFLELKRVLGDQIERIIIYGSYVSGSYTHESDLDIMVLSENQDIKSYEPGILDIIVNLSIKYNIVLSILLENLSNYTNRMRYVPFYQNVAKGIIVYGK
jgi:uncharacterized protein